MFSGSLVVLIVTSLVLGSWTSIAGAQSAPNTTNNPRDEWTHHGLSQWHVDKRDPERSIPTEEQRDADPLQFGYFLMDVSDLAEAALERKDHIEAIRYFKTLAKAVPERAVSFRKICTSYEALHDFKNAASYCKETLYKDGSVTDDYARYAQVMLTLKPDFSATDAIELDEVVLHLRNWASDTTLADEIACDLGLKLHDNGRMKACTARLERAAPNAVKTITYQWAYAIQRRDFGGAQRIIDHAKGLPIDASVIRSLEQGLAKYSHVGIHGWLLSRKVQLGTLLGGVLVLLITLAKRKRRPPNELLGDPSERPLLS